MNPKMTTTYYKVLETVYDNQISIGNEKYCPLGQAEIAKILNCHRMTVNSSLKELITDGYIKSNARKQYAVTEKGITIIQQTKDLL